MSGRNWCFTLNNYTPEEEAAIQKWEVTYMVYGHEVGESGTPHLQGYVKFQATKRLGAIKKLLPRAHWEQAKGDGKSNYAYCSKEDKEPFEIGEIPKTRGAAGGEGQKRKYEDAYENAKKNKLEDIPKDILVKHYSTFKTIAKDHMEQLPSLDVLDNHWWHGPTGTGKSRAAYTAYPGAYRKQCNKWWDGYQDEEVVIIDDFDKKHDILAHHLKIWCDHYPFIAEVKGGARMIRPKTIILTSNYTPEAIWGFETESRDPIERRFQLKKF